uniref:Uncharacterized protein n=1 Tax=Tanacetum cinerariifolium TaxID=118510 RepID=A0A699I1Q6_TANCI|nr:hypothetical protein [Tanacetum cinerariifolium]
MVSNFMASQGARLSKFKASFRQQSEMTSKIDRVLKVITDRMMGALPSDTVKNPKLNVNLTSLVSSALSYPMENPQCSTRQEEEGNLKNINTILPSLPNPSILFIIEKVRRLNSFLESSGLVSQSSDIKFVCTKEDDEDVMFIEIIKKCDDSLEEELEEDENAMTDGLGEHEMDNEVDERQEICSNETRELRVCNIRRLEMIKYSFGDDEEYVVVKEYEYDDLTSTNKDACRAYQEIFRMINEGWMVTRDE